MFISPIPSSITDNLFKRFLQELRNAVNGKVNYNKYSVAERDLIKTWVTGDTIFNEDTSKLNYYNGTNWIEL